MAEKLAEIVAQIDSVRQLEAVVTAMRGIAASRAQRGRSLLAGVEAYAEVVSRTIAQALTLLPPDGTAAPAERRRQRGLILFCAEQGFAGAFSERVLDTAHDAGEATIFLLGTRGGSLATERGIAPAWRSPMATHADGIPGLANRLAEALYERLAAGGLGPVDIVFSRTSPAGGITVDRQSLLPIDFSRFGRAPRRRTPFSTLPPALLIERLAAEYIYAKLCQATMHAFEAENEARMMAMGAARTNIGTKLDGLSLRRRQLAQQETTTEVVELATGAEALATGRFST